MSHENSFCPFFPYCDCTSDCPNHFVMQESFDNTARSGDMTPEEFKRKIRSEDQGYGMDFAEYVQEEMPNNPKAQAEWKKCAGKEKMGNN